MIKKPQAPTANYIDIYTVSKWNNEGSELDNKIAPVLEEDGSLKIQGGADNIGAAKIDCLSVNSSLITNDNEKFLISPVVGVNLRTFNSDNAA